MISSDKAKSRQQRHMERVVGLGGCRSCGRCRGCGRDVTLRIHACRRNPRSAIYCETHRLAHNARQRRRVARRKAALGIDPSTWTDERGRER